jgi:hypothetical protein
MRIREHCLVDALLLAASLCFLVLSLRLTPLAREAPLVTASLTTLLVCLQLVSDLRRPEASSGGENRRAEERRLLLLIFGLLGLLYIAGFSVTLPFFAGYYWRTRSGASWQAAASVAAGVALILEGLFGSLLGVGLHPGVLWQWLLT